MLLALGVKAGFVYGAFSVPICILMWIYLPETNPPTLLYAIVQDQLLFLCPSSSDSEPLQVLEFLHRVADVLEDFLGSPLLASRIEGHYDVVAQLLSEMVDGGIIACTEPNACLIRYDGAFSASWNVSIRNC